MTSVRLLALVCLLIFAGCVDPLGSEETPTEESPAPLVLDNESTDTASPTPDVGIDDRSPTPNGGNVSDEMSFPPGVSRTGIEDADALFANHSAVLERTGFVAVGNGSSVVSERGLLVEVETDQRNRVAANGSAYDIRRDAVAGPIERRVYVWSNSSVEYVHREENGNSNYTIGDSRPMAVLTGNGLLGPYIRGGDFEVREVRNTSDDRRVIVLNATEIANATVLERAVADDAEELTAYDAAVAIDADGRIRALQATIEYSISGQTATQQFSYELTSIGGVEIPLPDWIEEARGAINGTTPSTDDD